MTDEQLAVAQNEIEVLGVNDSFANTIMDAQAVLGVFEIARILRVRVKDASTWFRHARDRRLLAAGWPDVAQMQVYLPVLMVEIEAKNPKFVQWWNP